jgi:glycosyltransferase involved in cell wall biosynthesis
MIYSNENRMSEKPKCSVIITVYKRNKFVEEALYSLERQNIDKTLFEIIIITNIQLKLSRDYDLSIRIIPINNKTLAGKISCGINLANGDIITFLEDDDLYKLDRIKKIINIFQKYPDLTYYHNNSRHFRSFSEELLSNNDNKHHGAHNIYYTKMNIKENEILFSLNGIDYNLSSMAFARSFLLKFIDSIQNLLNRYIDSFLFFLVLNFGNSIFLDSSIETITRVHSENASSAVTRSTNHAKDHGNSIDLNAIICEFKKYGLIDSLYVQSFLILRGLDDLMKSNSIKRLECISRLIKAYKLQGHKIIISDVFKKALLYIISPILMEKMLNKYHKI